MLLPTLTIAIALSTQVPDPTSGYAAWDVLRRHRLSVLDGEDQGLSRLADKLAAEGKSAESEQVRRMIRPAPEKDGSTPFVPLAEIATADLEEKPSPLATEARSIRAAASKSLLSLAKQAAASRPPYMALADRCLREVLERDSNEPTARRLLGFVARNGGWATPFAARQLKEGKVPHPKYGWVDASWVPNLERGLLPAPRVSGRPTEWLPAARADELRRDWDDGWRITTEHFAVQANVPLDEAIRFAQRLEDFHQLFFSIMADVIGPNLPLAKRFQAEHTGKAATLSDKRQSLVSYFATRGEYASYLEPFQGRAVHESLGTYITPTDARRLGDAGLARSYSFRDQDGRIDNLATLYHEVSHQLLFENAGAASYERNTGHFWVFEGLGTYFETITERPDGSLRIGGAIGPRIEESRRRLVDRSEFIPIDEFVAMGRSAFNGGDVYLNYVQATALTVFFMQAEDGKYRDRFLDYARDAYKGRFRSGGRNEPAERIEVDFDTLGRELLSYLRSKSQPTASPPRR